MTAIYPQAEIRDNVVDYVTVIRFAPPPGRTLRPEMTTTVEILLDRRTGVLAVPIRAVRRDDDGAYVLIARDERAERRSIATGSRDESWWEVTAGLREGDRVVVGGTSDDAKEDG